MVCEESLSETATPSELLKIASTDSSSESSFRELDDAFLQTQTRNWLGEVLQIRLDEELIISELLADGELLFQVSKVVWKSLLATHMELRQIIAYKNHPFASKRNGGRYRPYSNVDSFLKICKILGLTGIDLFSPSDVVERGDTRRVCMCIRSFSKKSRSMNINVPDFDIVTCTVAMPKDVVGCIRRNIELSHSILADSSNYHRQKHVTGKPTQGYSVRRSTRDYKTCPDHSDDTEITHKVFQFNGLHTDELYDYKSEIDYNMQSLMGEIDFVSEDLDQLDAQNQQRNEISNDEFEFLSSMESLQDHCSDNIDHEHDSKMTWPSSSSCGDLNVDFIAMTSHLDARLEQVQESRIMYIDYFESSSASVVGTPTNDKTLVTDATLYAKSRKDSFLFDDQSSTPSVLQSASSHGSNLTPQTIESARCFDICDNMEQVASMSCLTREPLNLGDQFDAENNVLNIESFELYKDKNDQWDKIKEYEAQDIVKCNEMANGITSNARNSYFEEIEHSLCSPDCYFCYTISSDRAIPHNNDTSSTLLKTSVVYEDGQADSRCSDNANHNESEELLSCQSYYLRELCKWDQKGKCAMTSNRAKDNKRSSCFLEDGSHKETTPCKQEASEISMSKVILSCAAPNEEDMVSAAVNDLDPDGKELNNGSLALTSNALGVDDYEKCPTLGNNFYSEGITAQEIGGGSKRIQDMITNDVVTPTNRNEDVSHIGSGTSNQSSKHECNDSHQTCQYDNDSVSVYLPKHTPEEIKAEDESMHFLVDFVETEEEGIEIPTLKPKKKLLLRSVLGGATAVGLLFMVLHLRRNGGEKAGPPSKTSSHEDKENIQKNSPQKAKRTSSTTKGVYPAEKLKLK